MTTIGHTIALTAAALFLAACSDTVKAPEAAKDAAPSSKAGDTKNTTPPPPADTKVDAGVKIACFGANSCTGQSQCHVADGRYAAGSKGNACAGQNDCKGKGWLTLSESDCKTKGGTPL